MSNDEYMKLYEQFKPMIIKLCNKWSRSLILAKSRTLKEEYHKLHNIDDYSHTERLALLDS